MYWLLILRITYQNYTMKKNQFLKKLFVATVACFAFGMNANAQTINDAYASIADSIGENNVFTVVLSDSLGISQIETKLGTAEGNADLLVHVFDFDTQPSSPYSYNRSGNTLKLGIGTITQNGVYYGECRLKYPNGTWSNSFQFINN